MADVTYVISGPDGKKIGEQTMQPDFAPVLLHGQTAKVVEEPKPKKVSEKAADKAD